MKNFFKINRIKVFEKKDLLLKVDCKFLSDRLGVVSKSKWGLGRNQTVAIVKITMKATYYAFNYNQAIYSNHFLLVNIPPRIPLELELVVVVAVLASVGC